MPITFASLCCRPSFAVFRLYASAARADHLVCSNLFAVARAADHDAQRAGVGHGGLGRDAEDGIVVLGVVGLRPVVNHLVPVLGESLDEIILQLKSGVVAADVYAHGSTMADPAGTDERQRLQPALLQRSARPRDMQRLRLDVPPLQLLDAGRETADNVAARERGQHGRGCQAAFKIAEHPASLDAGDDLQFAGTPDHTSPGLSDQDQ